MLKFKNLAILLSFLVVFPINASAQLTNITVSDDLELIKLSENAYIHVSYLELQGNGRTPANGLIFINDSKAFIIDTPWNDELTKALIDWMQNNLNVEVVGMIATHSHEDCMGGLNEIHRRGIQSYASMLTYEIAEREKLPLPQNVFNKKISLDNVGKQIIAGYYGAGHAVDNIVVWVPSEKILFGGCMVKTLGARGLGNISDADYDQWPNTLKSVLEEYPDAEIVIPGHGPHGGIELIHHTIELFEDTDG
ncbi:subclass B1 metallo-beta-lactamase [Candidatus Latescibacterota bacterium]